MLRRMTPEDISDTRKPEDSRPGGPQSLWWAMHRPETYAIAALALAVTTLFSVALEDEVVRAFTVGSSTLSLRVIYGVPAAVRGGLALGAVMLAVMSIRSEDDDTTWSAPVARAAIVLAVIAAAFAVTTVIGVLVSDTPRIPGFTAPSP